MTINQKTFRLGGDLEVNRLGYGAMRLTGQPGNFGPYAAWDQGLALLRRAARGGVNFSDSARSYGPLHADRIVGEALEGLDVVIATKGGIDKPAPDRIAVDGSPATLDRQIDEALTNLRQDRIDLFQLHRVDPNTPLRDSVTAMAKAQQDGRIRHIGLSNVTLDQVREARDVADIASIQNRFNMAERGDDALLDYTTEHGVAFIPYGPLGAHPMRKGAQLPPRTALNWLLDRSPNIVVIPGTTSIRHLEENLSAWDADLAEKVG